MMRLIIREETPQDAAAIEAVTRAAFRNHPHGSENEQDIIRALRASGKLTLSVVAELEGAVVGHIAISPVAISDGTIGWYGLGPMAVAPHHQGRGIGGRLVEEALRMLRESGAAGCVLLGEPAYYGRFGFRQDPALRLPGPPPDYFLALHFTAGRPKGVVTYHEAFGTPG
jgi:putative acetyltransferase